MMAFTTVFFRFAWPLLALVGLIMAADTCLHTETQLNTVVTVFEDLNANGRLDRGEAPIPNVPIVFGEPQFSDAKGQVTVSGVFRPPVPSVHVFTPCGYRSTTETEFSPIGRSSVHVGFAPVSPRTGTAAIIFHLWEDQDGDSRQGTSEPALNFIEFGASYTFGSERLRTNMEGQTTLNLGNTCGTLEVDDPEDWYTVVFTPSTCYFRTVPYDVGITQVEWGLRRMQP
jgi:hypothetical protein